MLSAFRFDLVLVFCCYRPNYSNLTAFKKIHYLIVTGKIPHGLHLISYLGSHKAEIKVPAKAVLLSGCSQEESASKFIHIVGRIQLLTLQVFISLPAVS